MRVLSKLTRGSALGGLAAAVLLAGLAVSTHATTIRRMGLPEMVEQAGNVVRARALENRVRTDPDTLHHYTITLFETLEAGKGKMRSGELFEVEIIGGEAPGSGYATTIAGAPRFSAGEEVVLFTRPGRGGRKHLVGFSQGAVRMREVSGQKVLVAPPPEVVPTVQSAAGLRQSTVHRAGAPATVTAAPEGTAEAPVSTAPQAAATAPAPSSEVRGGGPITVEDFLQQVRRLDAAGREERP
jgi:hypothetical protein